MRISKSFHCLPMALLTLALAGCEDMVYDNEGDCEIVYDVQFVYDHNLKWADAFATEVDAVTLHVFDAATGEHVLSATEKGEQLARDDYRMRLDLPAGEYEMIAWCGEGAHDDGYSFMIPEVNHGATRRDDLTCRMTRSTRSDSERGIIDQEKGLRPLYHGYVKASLPGEDGTKVHLKMPLVKNTNSVRIILQSLKGKVIDPSMFDFSIEDSNGYMNWDNTLLDDQPLTYRAWSVTGAQAEIVDTKASGDAAGGDDDAVRAESTSPMSAVVADLTVGRLMADHRPMLTVTDISKGTPKTVFRIPIIDYALMIKGNYRKDIDNQEYLDRQDEYNMTFFLDENGEWINAYIIINKWKVVLEEFEVK